MKPSKFLVTGGAGFIGSAVIRFLLSETAHQVCNLDKLTYASSFSSLSNVSNSAHYTFIRGDICDRALVTKVFSEFQPNVVMHLAAESHVDQSIKTPDRFIQTNVVGTSVMLECSREYWKNSLGKSKFLFHHISTDEVYGSLGEIGLFSEDSAYDPSSPYSASKASSDHFVRAWHRTYGLPIIVTNCSNNYGPWQFPEKFIPLLIRNALECKNLPIYGNGKHIRDWLYVDDHVRALYKVVAEGKLGETYNIGGNNEKTNINVAENICDLFDRLFPEKLSKIKTHRQLIKYVTDRPGHDKRYAINTNKISSDLGWSPVETFESGLRKTVEWYINNSSWNKATTASS